MALRFVPRSPIETPRIVPPRTHVRITRRAFFWPSCLGLLLMGLTLFCEIVGPLPIAFAKPTKPLVLHSAPSTPNRINPTTGAAVHTRSPQIEQSGPAQTRTPQAIRRGFTMPMTVGTVTLTAGQPTVFMGSDKRLEVDSPAGAISAQDLTQAGGKVLLRVLQIAPASGSNAGGSGTFSLGTYLVQVLDAHGTLFSRGLRQPLTVKYHLQPKELALHLDHAYVVLNSTLTTQNVQVPGLVQPADGKTLASTLGSRHVQRTQLDLATKTLAVTPSISTPSTSLSWDGDSPISTFGKPDPASVALNAGALLYDLPIEVPSGPGDLTPPVDLKYSSADVNGQHNASAATGWVGEGWNLSLGAINWSEHDVTTYCTKSPCNPTWENEWALNNGDGSGYDLIPPNIDVSTYYDDTPNNYCATGVSPSYPCPILWHTTTETHEKIYAYVGPVNIGQAVNPPCFRIWETNGDMEEFGCTADSLQYYYEDGIGALITGWNLDMITDPQGNQIHLTYQQDMTPWTSSKTGKTYNYPRDVALSTITYDSPGCHNAQTMCTGSSWAPQMQVVFNANHTVAHITGTAPTGCNNGSNVRCDDAWDLSSQQNGEAAPLLQSTYVLNSIQVQTRTSGSGSWNTLRSYQLGYEQSGPSATITDPASGMNRSDSGMLDLTTFQELGSDGTSTLPKTTFSYSTQTNYYVDDLFRPNPANNCGPSWNTGNGNGCLLWSQSYPNNSRYISSVSNGQGLAQTFTWSLAHNNTHGVPGGGSNNANPFFCNGNYSGYPCNETDDEAWSQIVLTQKTTTTQRLTQNGQGGTQTTTPIAETTGYNYQVTYPLTAQMCSDCVAGMYWGNQNDGDYLSYYNGVFMGFAQATVNLPDGGVEVHNYYGGEGWGIYDTSQVTCFATHACHNDPWWALANAAHGDEYSTFYYDTDGKTLLRQINTTYQDTCPPSGVSGTPASSTYGNWDGNLVAEIDFNNPLAACDIHETQQTVQAFNGSSQSASATTKWSYDSYGRMTQETASTNGGTPAQVVTNASYVWNDNIAATKTSATGTYIIDTQAFTDTEDGSGNRLRCSYMSYDGQSYTTGQTSKLTGGLITSQDDDASCGTSANGYTPGGKSTTTTVYNASGDVIATTDPDGNAGNTSHQGCTIGSTKYTECTTYDSTYSVFPTASTNALNQTDSTSYSNTGNLYGYGTWPVSTTDANNQVTGYTYDALDRMTSETLPGESGGEQTTQWVYTNWCSGTSAQSPCEEIDQINRINNASTTTSRAFYDGEGRLVETRTPGPGSQDVVIYAYYDTSGNQIFKSNAYFVSSYSGSPGSAAYSIPDSTQPGTSQTYDALGRIKSMTDANSHTYTATYSIACGVSGYSDSGCYQQVLVLDPDGHQADALINGFGDENYIQLYSGTSSPYTLYATTLYTYNAAGDHLSTQAPDKSTTLNDTYDDLGQVISEQDPDSGRTNYTYDPNGNVTESVDARGSAGTIYTGYDGLDRQLWRNNTNSPTGAWVTYTYDSTASGNQGVGELTGESFTGSGGLSGSYSYTYDNRGRQTAQTTTVNGTSYPLTMSYDDSDQMTSETYPTGETVTINRSSSDWLTGLTTTIGGTTTSLASNVTYTGFAGAAGSVTGMSLGNNTYTYAASYDTGLRLTSKSLTKSSTSTLLYQTQPAYDAADNVTGVQTAIGGQTDTQQFCYDSLSRLTWAGTNGTPPCTGTSITSGTLTGAQYQQSDSYDTDGRLTGGPAGNYTYGSSQPHAVISTTSGFSAAYDAAGNMICRAVSSATTCSGGSPTGQKLGYDAEGRLSSWQNTPTSPTESENYLYDGDGNRVAVQSTVNGSTTTTAYIGDIEEVQTSSGVPTQVTTYYFVDGERIAANVSGVFYYFGYDGLNSQVVVLDASGNIVGAQLYGPYGSSRYSNGTLPTSIGFTSQRTDSVTGLDYDNARYYDPVIGAFISPDSVQGNEQGISPYTYVWGNPETEIDPSGHMPIPGFDSEEAAIFWNNLVNNYPSTALWLLLLFAPVNQPPSNTPTIRPGNPVQTQPGPVQTAPEKGSASGTQEESQEGSNRGTDQEDEGKGSKSTAPKSSPKGRKTQVQTNTKGQGKRTTRIQGGGYNRYQAPASANSYSNNSSYTKSSSQSGSRNAISTPHKPVSMYPRPQGSSSQSQNPDIWKIIIGIIVGIGVALAAAAVWTWENILVPGCEDICPAL